MGRKTQIRCHGDASRFDEVADFIYERFGNSIKYIADVAGGQGLLTKILNKKYNYECEVIDPRGWTLVGVPSIQKEFTSEMADFYDLIIGLHPDEATLEVAKSAFKKQVLLVPCCNFWTREKKLGSKALIEEICNYFRENEIEFSIFKFSFAGPKNVGIITSGLIKKQGMATV